eukprot:CAMPEP_0185038128 /NCGR_PEP_ID=MMETSP1103-20130426/33407_1 /TAXON_ID=36769 /ORGANISM="Paraphysomonas bandaiensis, Strain Caron Lab Isolate" /LENGTH=202 /DNA_ID=CAMNT_0027576421 /DNA_START=134 /DNA_END=742 /DNA_ORIENTATION=-
MAVLSFISLIFSIIPVVSASFNEDDVQNTSWTYGKTSDDDEIWIGLSIFVYKFNGNTDSTGWGSTDCKDVGDSDFCDDCKESCLGAVSMVITNLITTIPNIKGNIERSTRKGDSNFEKNQAVISGLIGSLSTLSALAIYMQGCQNSLPDHINGVDVDYVTGPGLACLAIATFLQPVNAIGNLLTPVVKDEDDNGEGDYVIMA